MSPEIMRPLNSFAVSLIIYKVPGRTLSQPRFKGAIVGFTHYMGNHLACFSATTLFLYLRPAPYKKRIYSPAMSRESTGGPPCRDPSPINLPPYIMTSIQKFNCKYYNPEMGERWTELHMTWEDMIQKQCHHHTIL